LEVALNRRLHVILIIRHGEGCPEHTDNQ
jgi:hypothetical protein